MIIFLIVILNKCGYSQSGVYQPVRIMFYNAENLFDIYDDTLKDDDDFLPEGLMRWNLTRYNKKINSLYKTIIAAGEWDPPALVALCEVENRKVLEDLIYDTYLSKNKYRIIHEESADQRGIDVCLIYREDFASLIYFKYWIPPRLKSESFTTRSVLYSKWIISNDTLHIIVNHWPSRRGGVLAMEDTRMEIAAMVRTKADSIMRSSPLGAKILIMGDFNCTPDDIEMKTMIADPLSGILLVNLSEAMAADGQGTYRYMGIWEMIDQVIVSDRLLTCNSGLYTDSRNLRIFKPDFLLAKDPKYPGFTPLSTYRGYKYQGGFSDHLPVLIDLKVK